MSEAVQFFKRGGNEAIKINKPTGTDFHLTARGSDWLWTVFCVNLFAAIILIFLMFKKPVDDRFLYYTVIAPLLFMSIAYFTMASNLGWTGIQAKYNHNRVSTQTTHLGIRQIFYSRYVGWFLAMPFPVIQASILGKTPLWQMFFNILLTEFFVVCMLIAALVHSTYKWGYFSFAVFSSWVVMTSILTTTKNLCVRAGNDVYTVFKIYVSLIFFFWLIYPISFGLSEGGNVLVVDSEMIFYGILDICFLCFCPLAFLPLANYIGVEKLGYNFHHEDHEASGA